MDLSVNWTEAALDDLQQIADYIGRDSSVYAAAIVQEAFSAADTLKRFAEAGGIVPEFDDPSIRELFIRKYRMIYLIESERVLVVAIVHGARHLGDAWQSTRRQITPPDT